MLQFWAQAWQMRTKTGGGMGSFSLLDFQKLTFCLHGLEKVVNNHANKG